MWIEKDALAGVFTNICNRLRLPLYSCRGYTSLSEMWTAGLRIKSRSENHGRATMILHFGDHDPSGIDMTRDIEERIEMFTDNQDIVGVQRCALNIDQIHEFDPPPNFAKEKDTRTAKYFSEFGTRDCWELDALEPTVLEGIVRDYRDVFVDQSLWEEQERLEMADREIIAEQASRMKTR